MIGALMLVLFFAVAFSVAAYRVFTEKISSFYGMTIEYSDAGSIAMAIFFAISATIMYGVALYYGVKHFSQK